jgi:hypothetical protein
MEKCIHLDDLAGMGFLYWPRYYMSTFPREGC